jgi:hypothetical protein
MRRSVGVLSAGIVVAALTLQGAGVVRADTQVGGGALVVSVTANLPSFPCASCTSTASGFGIGTVAGVDATTKAKAVAVFAKAAYSTAFTYHEACPSVLAGKPVTPPEGFANGNYVLGPGTMVGAPGPAFLTGNFNYTRVGLTAVITTTNNQLHSGSSTGPTIGPAALGASVGIFVPLKAPGNCTTLTGPPATIGVESVAVAAA